LPSGTIALHTVDRKVMEMQIETELGRFVIRPYQEGDETGILSLWKAAFGKEIPRALWRWKYLKNPYPVQIALAVGEDGTIRVMYGGIPYRATWKNERVTVTHLMDIMSHPNYRKSGLFVKTGTAFFDLYAGPHRTCFYYGFPGKYHFDIGKKYLKYTDLENGVSFLRAETRALARNKARFGGRIERITQAEGVVDDIWDLCVRDYPLAVIRDSAFIRWRFFEHPLNPYEVWGYRSFFRKDWKGYAVLAVEGEKARMVDLLLPFSRKTAVDFLARMGSQVCGRGIMEIETWLPQGHFMTGFAESAGFRPFEEPLGFIPTGRSFHPDLSVDWASRHLYYTMADGDLL
jgi:hypothetical protein